MRYPRMVGLAAMAVVALLSLGAGTASATVLCKEDKSPCGSDFPGGTEIKGQLPAGVTNLWRKAGKVVDTCSAATLVGFSSNTGGFSSAVFVPLKTLTWTGCTTAKEVIKPGTLEITYTGASETVGTLKLKEIQWKEAGCTYGYSSLPIHVGRMKKSATALSPATFEIDATFPTHFGISLCRIGGIGILLQPHRSAPALRRDKLGRNAAAAPAVAASARLGDWPRVPRFQPG